MSTPDRVEIVDWMAVRLADLLATPEVTAAAVQYYELAPLARLRDALRAGQTIVIRPDPTPGGEERKDQDRC